MTYSAGNGVRTFPLLWGIANYRRARANRQASQTVFAKFTISAASEVFHCSGAVKGIEIRGKFKQICCQKPNFGSDSMPQLTCNGLPPTLRPHAGRSSAWLERLLWEQEVARSNRVAPIEVTLALVFSREGFSCAAAGANWPSGQRIGWISVPVGLDAV